MAISLLNVNNDDELITVDDFSYGHTLVRELGSIE